MFYLSTFNIETDLQNRLIHFFRQRLLNSYLGEYLTEEGLGHMVGVYVAF